MRIQVLFASAAVLAACGGSTSPVTSAAPDAGSDHISGQGEPAASSSESRSVAPPAKGASVRHPTPSVLHPSVGGSSSSSGGGSGSSSGGGADASTGGSFSCGGVMCNSATQYCSVTMNGPSNTNANCQDVPFGCTSGATCGCVQQFDGGLFGCSCADNGGRVTVTCRY